jgi:hypothetical protein
MMYLTHGVGTLLRDERVQQLVDTGVLELVAWEDTATHIKGADNGSVDPYQHQVSASRQLLATQLLVTTRS